MKTETMNTVYSLSSACIIALLATSCGNDNRQIAVPDAGVLEDVADLQDTDLTDTNIEPDVELDSGEPTDAPEGDAASDIEPDDTGVGADTDAPDADIGDSNTLDADVPDTSSPDTGPSESDEWMEACRGDVFVHCDHVFDDACDETRIAQIERGRSGGWNPELAPYDSCVEMMTALVCEWRLVSIEAGEVEIEWEAIEQCTAGHGALSCEEYFDAEIRDTVVECAPYFSGNLERGDACQANEACPAPDFCAGSSHGYGGEPMEWSHEAGTCSERQPEDSECREDRECTEGLTCERNASDERVCTSVM